MIERYTYPEMGRIWTGNEFQKTMLDIEICACEIMAELGEIPAGPCRSSRRKPSSPCRASAKSRRKPAMTFWRF